MGDEDCVEDGRNDNGYTLFGITWIMKSTRKYRKKMEAPHDSMGTRDAHAAACPLLLLLDDGMGGATTLGAEAAGCP
jgi:hypothetical protein